MKKILVTVLVSFVLLQPTTASTYEPSAPPIFGIVRAAIKRAIKAIDLRVQRLQNKTIWLQNAQKEIENTLSKLKLAEISDWTKKQGELYQQYYNELQQVKSIITSYHRIRDVTEKQSRLVEEYQRYWQLFVQDDHFTPSELDYMQKVYNGILGESLSNMELVFEVLESFTTSISDAERLALINAAADKIDRNYDDLRLFNRKNVVLSLQRAKTKADVQRMKFIYGLP